MNGVCNSSTSSEEDDGRPVLKNSYAIYTILVLEIAFILTSGLTTGVSFFQSHCLDVNLYCTQSDLKVFRTFSLYFTMRLLWILEVTMTVLLRENIF
jgi:hypothetical protein